ncbi:hypothetical protein Rai3103_07130 [Raineyella fluvialis]|uniref:Sel1 repeat-containing protein n=1 Tax=Raineyella fluvialis TaxID=2662261 RepID=A0A5Q2F9X1_9ACTN|nr:hypothetical protein Rai3103_07130 [Raineyella fluvialis]
MLTADPFTRSITSSPCPDRGNISGCPGRSTGWWEETDDPCRGFRVGESPFSAAIEAYTSAAKSGDTNAMNRLGILLGTRMDPPDLIEARHWWTTAANAGNTSAMNNLAILLATKTDPPDLIEARHWWTTAANAGNTSAMNNLAILLATKTDPPT